LDKKIQGGKFSIRRVGLCFPQKSNNSFGKLPGNVLSSIAIVALFKKSILVFINEKI